MNDERYAEEFKSISGLVVSKATFATAFTQISTDTMGAAFLGTKTLQKC